MCDAVRTVSGDMRCLTCGLIWDYGDAPPCPKDTPHPFATIDRLAGLIDTAAANGLAPMLVEAMQSAVVELAMRHGRRDTQPPASPMVQRARNVIGYP